MESNKKSLKKIIVKDFDGSNIMETNCDALYRLVSNNKNYVLGIDGTYQVIGVSMTENTIKKEQISVQKGPVLFYSLGTGTSQFILHYNYSINESKLGAFFLDADVTF